MRTLSRCRGRCTPGVSTKTICPSGRVWRAGDAVAGWSAACRRRWPACADQPVQQRGLAGVGPADQRDEAATSRGRALRPRPARALVDPHPGHPATLGLEHLDRQPVDVDPFALGRARGRASPAGSRRPSRSRPARPRCRTAAPAPRRAALPLKTKMPRPSSTIGSTSTSYSSRISPTISSSRSSSVTSPAVPPYSSTTMALCTRLRWNSSSSSGTRLVSGTKWAGRISARNGRPGASSGCRTRSLTNDEAEDVVERAVVDRHARVLLLAERADAARSSEALDLDGDDVGTRRHDLADHRLAEVDERAQQRPRRPRRSRRRRSCPSAGASGRRRRWPARRRWLRPPPPARVVGRPTRSSAQVSGRSSRATASNDGSSHREHALRVAADRGPAG